MAVGGGGAIQDYSIMSMNSNHYWLIEDSYYHDPSWLLMMDLSVVKRNGLDFQEKSR